MNLRSILGRSGVVAAACVACCAPPIIAAVGLTAGVAATLGVFLGLTAAIAVVAVGVGWIAVRTRRTPSCDPSGPTPVSLSAPPPRHGG